MRIHFHIAKDFLKGGGIETYTREVGTRLAARGHEVTVYSVAGSSSRPAMWNGVRIIWLPRMRPYWLEMPCGAIFAALRSFLEPPPDIAHLHSVAAGATSAILKWRNVPCIVQLHGIEWMRSRWGTGAKLVLKALERLSFLFGDTFTAVSQVQCTFYEGRYAVPVTYIPTAAEARPPVPPDLLLTSGIEPRNYVLFASRLVPEKGAHYLIKAFREAGTDSQLIIAGDGPRGSRYVAELRQLAFGDPRIVFLGYVKGRFLAELFSNARMFVQPSEIEGLPIALLEAMAYRNICIASDIPENIEAIGEAGIVFRSGDCCDLANKIRWVISHETAVTELRRQAGDRVVQLFSWERVTDSLEKLYEWVVITRSNDQPKKLRAAQHLPGRRAKERLAE